MDLPHRVALGPEPVVVVHGLDGTDGGRATHGTGLTPDVPRAPAPAYRAGR